jgi:hypothetical protein
MSMGSLMGLFKESRFAITAGMAKQMHEAMAEEMRAAVTAVWRRFMLSGIYLLEVGKGFLCPCSKSGGSGVVFEGIEAFIVCSRMFVAGLVLTQPDVALNESHFELLDFRFEFLLADVFPVSEDSEEDR